MYIRCFDVFCTCLLFIGEFPYSCVFCIFAYATIHRMSHTHKSNHIFQDLVVEITGTSNRKNDIPSNTSNLSVLWALVPNFNVLAGKVDSKSDWKDIRNFDNSRNTQEHVNCGWISNSPGNTGWIIHPSVYVSIWVQLTGWMWHLLLQRLGIFDSGSTGSDLVWAKVKTHVTIDFGNSSTSHLRIMSYQH